MTGKGNGQRKRRYYTKLPSLQGPLRRSASLHRLVRANPNQAPPWWGVFGRTADEWRRAVEAGKKKAFDDWWQSILAVYEHFGISISAPGASKDLALSLAYRHEQDLLVQGKRICYAALCERYGVNPDKEGWDTSLALALAHKYVGNEIGPSARRPDDWGTKFNTLELTKLVIAVASVKDHLHRNGERASVRAIAECLQDEKRLARVIPKKAAEAVHAIFLRRGNKSRGMSKPLSDTRLRQLIGEMQTLPIALGARELTPVQRQLYFSVNPLLDGLVWAE